LIELLDEKLLEIFGPRNKTRVLKQGMMQELLNGRIWLVGVTPGTRASSPHAAKMAALQLFRRVKLSPCAILVCA